ncbi:uncharacterized protein N7515_009326 [Penicillium bovifimosum]|uniref:Uncharacterized protein n=1 Tax=Penicillium bovifimosum TaxID=126998 RepID=A0A9W9GJ29_9EURO|nr:uncharacterized protein N7515_009326 [Penicillium bovifimosum]KAJ5121365.1 hypothetical protein N7515_009326 [Penicillium bovifimosum]
MAELTTTNKSKTNDVATNADKTPADIWLPPQLRRTINDLKSAIDSVISVQSISRFLDFFSDLNEQTPDVQSALQGVARYARRQEDRAARKIKKAQEAVGDLSDKDRYDLQRFYAEDLVIYLGINIPFNLETGLSEDFRHAQITIFDFEHWHRALVRVRGIQAHITDVFSGLHCIQELRCMNAAEEAELLLQRANAEGKLNPQFWELDQEEQVLAVG